MVYTENATVKLESLHCTNCGILFAVDETVLNGRRETGGSFYCPNGHSLTYGETELTRLRAQVVQKETALERKAKDVERINGYLREEQAAHRSTSKRLNATKGVVTRYKRRIVAGSCVACSKKFKDLGKHMKEQHPNLDPDKQIEALVAKA